jgi:hypothetical protein
MQQAHINEESHRAEAESRGMPAEPPLSESGNEKNQQAQEKVWGYQQ